MRFVDLCLIHTLSDPAVGISSQGGTIQLVLCSKVSWELIQTWAGKDTGMQNQEKQVGYNKAEWSTCLAKCGSHAAWRVKGRRRVHMTFCSLLPAGASCTPVIL